MPWCASDLIDAWVFALAVLVVVLATPLAGAIGTSVHETRSQLFAAQSQTKQQVTATATEEGSLVLGPEHEASLSVRATWYAAGRDHVEVIEWPSQAKIVDRHEIWVNDQGLHVQPPRSPGGAGADVVGVTLSVWVGVAATAAGFVHAVRRLRRDATRLGQYGGRRVGPHARPD